MRAHVGRTQHVLPARRTRSDRRSRDITRLAALGASSTRGGTNKLKVTATHGLCHGSQQVRPCRWRKLEVTATHGLLHGLCYGSQQVRAV